MKLFYLCITLCTVLNCFALPQQDETVPRQFALPPYKIYYQWKQIDFHFPPSTNVSGLKSNGSYIQLNVIPTAIKVYRDRAFIATPRYKPGVPVTLSSIRYNNRFEFFGILVGGDQSPKFKPFPSYPMQEEGNCSALQLVQSMEVDQFGRLWIVDVGRTQLLGAEPRNLCPAKILVVDLTAGDKIISTYEFPADVAPPTATFVKDFQVACQSRAECWVYISDPIGNLVVYNYGKNESYIVKHPTMLPDPAKENFTINGVPTSVPYGINGIALAPRNENFSVLYYSPLASLQVYKVNTSVLQDPARKTNPDLSDSDVLDIGAKPGQSDGMAMDNRGTLRYGDLPGSAVYSTELMQRSTSLGTQRRIAQSTKDLLFPDQFGFDGRGNLLLTTTKFHLFIADMIKPNEVNYRVLKFTTGTNAYNAA